MTNDEINPNDEIRTESARFQRAVKGLRSNRIRQLLVIRTSSFIRHSSFVIRH